MNIHYQIEFFTDWHCGSGLSSGADLDLLVIKDKDRLPFVPGKTMKGLIREAVEEISGFSKSEIDLTEIFGVEANSANSIETKQGCCFFTNAELKDELKNAIKSYLYQEYLYHSIASTSIDEKGIADDKSLRKIEVCVPCKLYGQILDVPDEPSKEIIIKGLKFIKRLGQNRNRGLGRCSISIINGGEA
ncbi:MAG: RAMP superfamily CRISPR-associated protein [Prevotellaceae bacterium]|jgi:CRISPR/Cas system CSM-associated protein Csm3 (group 7 of RAMP superfamily)|nr:RAMP superfamily CRISPR-associated protein [Prevotellaceae bacterium]